MTFSLADRDTWLEGANDLDLDPRLVNGLLAMAIDDMTEDDMAAPWERGTAGRTRIALVLEALMRHPGLDRGHLETMPTIGAPIVALVDSDMLPFWLLDGSPGLNRRLVEAILLEARNEFLPHGQALRRSTVQGRPSALRRSLELVWHNSPPERAYRDPFGFIFGNSPPYSVMDIIDEHNEFSRTVGDMDFPLTMQDMLSRGPTTDADVMFAHEWTKKLAHVLAQETYAMDGPGSYSTRMGAIVFGQ